MTQRQGEVTETPHSAHPSLSSSNIKLVFLPPNMTLRLQPCDAGIVATVKSHYRKHLVRHVFAEMDTPNTATELSKWVNVLDAIGWLWLAVVGCGWGWCSVLTSTIVKCRTVWVCAGDGASGR